MSAAAAAVELHAQAPLYAARPALAVHEVLLLAGTPVRERLLLPSDVAPESSIEVAGRSWLVAQVRERAGEPPLVVCIHDV